MFGERRGRTSGDVAGTVRGRSRVRLSWSSSVHREYWTLDIRLDVYFKLYAWERVPAEAERVCRISLSWSSGQGELSRVGAGN